MSIFAYGNKAKCEGQFMEDSCYVGKIGKYVVLMIADGNGSTLGNVDSGTLVTTIANDWLSHTILKTDGSEKDISMDDIGESLDAMFFGLSRCFITMAALDEKYSALYSSLIVSVIDELSLEMVTASIGNCEYHIVRNGSDRILNNIQSEAYQEFKQGKLSEEAWRESPKRGLLTSAIGGFDEPTVDVFKTNLEPNDILVLTTDGLLHVTGPAGILDELFNNADDIGKATDAVLQKAEDLKCPDNCALVVGYVQDDVRGRSELTREKAESVLDNEENNARGSLRTQAEANSSQQRRPSPSQTVQNNREPQRYSRNSYPQRRGARRGGNH